MIDQEKLDKEQLRAEIYDPFRAIMDGIEARVLERPLEKMWFSAMWEIKHIEKAVERGGDDVPAEVVDFWHSYGEPVIDILVEEVRPAGDRESAGAVTQAKRAMQVMHEISDVFSRDEDMETAERVTHTLGFDELCQLSDRFKIETKVDETGVERRYFYIYSPKRDKWFDYPIPNTDAVLHKGGLGRTILKILYNDAPELSESELPPHDYDYIAVKSPQAEEDLRGLRADPDGIEEVSVINLAVLMNNRDLDINNAFVGKDGLVFAESAYWAAVSGKIAIVATKRGIYGSEIFFHEGVRLIKNRGMMRLLKTVAEGKATSFDFMPINEQVDLGIYWMVLAKRFAGKADFPLFMDRLFELAKQMGQVREGEADIYQVLDRVHTKYPFYNFDGRPLDEEGVARWLGRKLLKQADKKYRDVNSVPSLLDMERRTGDTEAYEVSLAGYKPSTERLDAIRAGWQNYLARCRRRTADYLDEAHEGEENDD